MTTTKADPELSAFINGIRDVLGLDPLPTNDQHGRASARATGYHDSRQTWGAELEREARRFYVAPPDASGMTPRRGSGA